MKLVDTTEKETLQTVYEKVLDNLTGIDYESWESKFNQSGYMVQLNEDTVVQEDQSTIITSMRNVDATSRLKVKIKENITIKIFSNRLGENLVGAEQNINRGKLVGENGPGSIYIDTEGISYLISSADEWYKTVLT